MIVACSSCKHRFEAAGYRDQHCPACGSLAQQPGARPCPRCELPLTPREVAGMVLDECSKCHGVFVDDEAIRLVLDDPQHTRAQALVAELVRAAYNPLPPAGGKMYVKCPVCSVLMNRKLSPTGAGVVVDVCKAHGTFFDAGELPAIVEHVQRGGGKPRAAAPATKPSPAPRTGGSPSSGVVDGSDAVAIAELLVEILS